MASAWGKAWGKSWGNSWGAVETTPSMLYGPGRARRKPEADEDEELMAMLAVTVAVIQTNTRGGPVR